jgi:predicted transposase YbfD/YdcC
MVSAWAQQNNLVLGQVKVDDKSNEITDIPELRPRLDIAFKEDSNRARKRDSTASLVVIRHIALNLIKAEKTFKVGIKVK